MGELQKRLDDILVTYLKFPEEGYPIDRMIKDVINEMRQEFPVKRSNQPPCVEQLVWEDKLERWKKKWLGDVE